MKKKIINLIIMILIFSISIIPVVHADEDVYMEYHGNSAIYMHDLADLLTQEDESALMIHFGNEFEDLHYNVLFLTIDDAEGQSVTTYTDYYMNDLFPDYEHNIAFVIDMDNRKIHINTMGNAIKCLSDDKIDAAIDSAYNFISKEYYVDGLHAMAEYCVKYLSDNPDAAASKSAFVDGLVSGLIPGAIAAAAVVLILLGIHNKANKVQSATAYIGRDNYVILNKTENHIRTYDTVQRNYYKPKSSSSGGGGGSSHSSGGRSHGGGSRSF